MYPTVKGDELQGKKQHNLLKLLAQLMQNFSISMPNGCAL